MPEKKTLALKYGFFPCVRIILQQFSIHCSKPTIIDYRDSIKTLTLSFKFGENILNPEGRESENTLDVTLVFNKTDNVRNQSGIIFHLA